MAGCCMICAGRCCGNILPCVDQLWAGNPILPCSPCPSAQRDAAYMIEPFWGTCTGFTSPVDCVFLGNVALCSHLCEVYSERTRSLVLMHSLAVPLILIRLWCRCVKMALVILGLDETLWSNAVNKLKAKVLLKGLLTWFLCPCLEKV